MRPVHLLRFAATGGIVAGMTGALFAQQAGAPQERRIEGGWVRTDTAGSGSFGGLGASLPQAQLTPEGAARGGAGGAGGAGPNVGRGGLPPAVRPNAAGVPPYRLASAEALAAFERSYMRRLIETTGGNASAAARAANMDRPYLLSLLRRHGQR